jgi:hypothetical protein
MLPLLKGVTISAIKLTLQKYLKKNWLEGGSQAVIFTLVQSLWVGLAYQSWPDPSALLSTRKGVNYTAKKFRASATDTVRRCFVNPAFRQHLHVYTPCWLCCLVAL